MKTYATPKEALLDAGRITAITRGRISRDNHEWLDAEQKAGRIRISNAITSKPVKDITEPVKTKYSSATEKVIEEFHILYPKDLYHAKGADNAIYGMAEVCNTCRVSLVQCQCGHPTILGNIPVRIIPNG